MKTYKIRYEITIEAEDPIEAKTIAHRIAIENLERKSKIVSITRFPERMLNKWYIFNKN